MTKSELIDELARQHKHLAHTDVELAVKAMLEQMSQALAAGDRIEIRGFGSFSLHYRPPRMGRNPKTGEAVALPGKHVPHFKPGKELRGARQRGQQAPAPVIRKLLAVLVVLAFVASGLVFGSLNNQAVTVDYFFFETETALAFSLVLFLLAGVALGGVVVYLSMVARMRSRLRTARRELEEARNAADPAASTQLSEV